MTKNHMFYVKNYTFMKNQNFLLIQNEKKNTISKPFHSLLRESFV